MWRKRKNIVSASNRFCVPYLIQLTMTIGMDRWVRVTSSTLGCHGSTSFTISRCAAGLLISSNCRQLQATAQICRHCTSPFLVWPSLREMRLPGTFLKLYCLLRHESGLKRSPAVGNHLGGFHQWEICKRAPFSAFCSAKLLGLDII